MMHVFDSLMMINVLEHIENLFIVLQNIYNALVPGGILIFNDRWWDAYNHNIPVSKDTQEGLDHIYHPIRCHRNVFDHFLSKFEIIFQSVDPLSITKYNGHGIYFIGRKK